MTTTDKPKTKWTYESLGGLNFPVRMGELWAAGPHMIACIDLTREFDRFRSRWEKQPKMIYTDPPWNTGLVRGFFTKAGRPKGPDYATVIGAILDIARQLKVPAWMEASIYQEGPTRQLIEGFHGKIQELFEITYFHRDPAHLYQCTWGPEWTAPENIAGQDDDKTPTICMAHAVQQGYLNPGDVVLDTCTGLGLSVAGAIATGLTFYGSELSPYRMSASLTRLRDAGYEPKLVTIL